jgi:hypothetical protein
MALLCSVIENSLQLAAFATKAQLHSIVNQAKVIKDFPGQSKFTFAKHNSDRMVKGLAIF